MFLTGECVWNLNSYSFAGGAGAGAGLAQAAIKGSAAKTKIRQILPNNINNFFPFI